MRPPETAEKTRTPRARPSSAWVAHCRRLLHGAMGVASGHARCCRPHPPPPASAPASAAEAARARRGTRTRCLRPWQVTGKELHTGAAGPPCTRVARTIQQEAVPHKDDTGNGKHACKHSLHRSHRLTFRNTSGDWRTRQPRTWNHGYMNRFTVTWRRRRVCCRSGWSRNSRRSNTRQWASHNPISNDNSWRSGPFWRGASRLVNMRHRASPPTTSPTAGVLSGSASKPPQEATSASTAAW